MKMKMNNNEVFKREFAAIEATSDERRFELSFSSEKPYERCFGNEILEHSSDSIDLSRLEQIGVLLFNHDVDKVIGKIEKVWIDETARKGKAVIFFDDDEQSNVIFEKVKSGTLKGVSVGYVVKVWEEVVQGAYSTDGRFQGECYIAKKWQPLEISIVSVPADASVGVGRSAEIENENLLITEEINNSIEEVNQKNNDIKNMEVSKMEEKEIKDLATKAEQTRTAEILGMGEHYGVSVNEFVKSGATVDEVKTHIMEQLSKSQKSVASGVEVKVDEADKFRNAMTDAIALRAGAKIDKPASGATELRGLNMLEIAKEVMERSGQNIRGASNIEIATRALTATSDLPNILANVSNKILAKSYELAPSTWERFCNVVPVSDFKTITRAKLSELPAVSVIAEGASYPEMAYSDDKESYVISTKGGIVNFTRQALINDDLGALNNQSKNLGVALRSAVNRDVYAVLNSSHLMNDGKELFQVANHKNTVTTGTALTLDSLQSAKVAMARQTGLKGQVLNISPKFLVVPPELEFTARQLIFSTADITKANSGAYNPFSNALEIIVDPCLTDAKAWYLLADYNMVDTIEVAFLNGVQTPYIENFVEFTNDGIKTKARLDFGVKAIDYRGMFKNLGI